MMGKCYFLWQYALPDGTCAQWFSGTATAVAVAVALGAHFYSAWRDKSSEQRRDAAEIAGISMLVRGILKDAEANVHLFINSCWSFQLWGNDYTLSRNFGAVRALQFDLLNKDQSDVLLRYDAQELAEEIYTLIARENFLNLGIEDYSRLRSDFAPLVDKHLGENTEEKMKQDSEEARMLIKRLGSVSHSAIHFIQESRNVLAEAIREAESFNEFCSKHARFAKYAINTTPFRRLLKTLADQKK